MTESVVSAGGAGGRGLAQCTVGTRTAGCPCCPQTPEPRGRPSRAGCPCHVATCREAVPRWRAACPEELSSHGCPAGAAPALGGSLQLCAPRQKHHLSVPQCPLLCLPRGWLRDERANRCTAPETESGVAALGSPTPWTSLCLPASYWEPESPVCQAHQGPGQL